MPGVILQTEHVMAEQDLNIETELKISKSPSALYEAIVNPDEMSGYFISSGSGRLDSCESVTWKWDDVGAELTVTPQDLETNRRVCFLWHASGIETRVVIQLDEQGEGVSIVKVNETGWSPDYEGIARCLEQMQGWMNMLCCLKAYVEHGINLRE